MEKHLNAQGKAKYYYKIGCTRLIYTLMNIFNAIGFPSNEKIPWLGLGIMDEQIEYKLNKCAYLPIEPSCLMLVK